MLNFQVDVLDALLDALIADGVEVDPKRERYDYGSFGWFTDPEGNRVESPSGRSWLIASSWPARPGQTL